MRSGAHASLLALPGGSAVLFFGKRWPHHARDEKEEPGWFHRIINKLCNNDSGTTMTENFGWETSLLDDTSLGSP